MTQTEILNSIHLKKRFVKDCNLPITIFDEPYFSDRLQSLDRIFGCVYKFNIFCTELEKYESEQDYFTEYNNIKDCAIKDIHNSDKFLEFISYVNSEVDLTNNYSGRDLFVEENDGKDIISIDMKKANFSALHHFSPEIFGGATTWENFISKYTNSEHIKNSKYIRQVVLGACNPKQQVKYETFIMSMIADLVKCFLPDDTGIFSVKSDEILIVPSGSEHTSIEIFTSIKDKLPNMVRVNLFTVHKFNEGWYKIYLDGTSEIPEFKCVDAEIFSQVIKSYYNEPITDSDLVFYHNGKLAKFLSEVDIRWK